MTINEAGEAGEADKCWDIIIFKQASSLHQFFIFLSQAFL
jgi:hypothetical protein